MTLQTDTEQDFFDSIEIDVLTCDNKTPKVKAKDRAFNDLDKKPDQHDAKSIETLVQEFLSDPIADVTFKGLKKAGKLNVQKVIEWAKPEEIALRILLSALSVQRPINWKHIKKINERYNPLKVQFVNVLKIKFKGKYYYYVIDGQHTATVIGIRAYWGLIEGYDSSNWTEVPIRCQVVECDNFIFAREHFLGINGDDKLELARFDKWKNMVLGKRQDSPDDELEDHPDWEDAYTQQVSLESYSIIPVHENNKEQLRQPGAFTRVDLIKDMGPDDLHWICQAHQLNWDDKPFDSFEVMPMKRLRDRLKCDTSFKNSEITKFISELGNIIKNTVKTPAAWRSLTETTYKNWVRTVNGDDAPKKISVDEEASLALLLQSYYRAGGKFSKLRRAFLDDFKSNQYELFDAMDEDLKNIIEK